MKNDYLKLCLVTNLASKKFDQYESFILSAIRGGVTSVQVREKNISFKELKAFCIHLQSLLKIFEIPLLINDNVQLTKEINADGVHLGQSDLSPMDARKILGPNKIIGLSIESLEELKIANQLNCLNYVSASAIFPSKTKTDCKRIWGLEDLKNFTQQSQKPVMAIGGIDTTNVGEIIDCGASGVAVISVIHDHPNTAEITALLINKINEKLSERSARCLT